MEREPGFEPALTRPHQFVRWVALRQCHHGVGLGPVNRMRKDIDHFPEDVLRDQKRSHLNMWQLAWRRGRWRVSAAFGGSGQLGKRT